MRRRSSRRAAVAAGLVLVTLTACSGAKVPEASGDPDRITSSGTPAPGSSAGSSASPGATTGPSAGTPGVPGQPGQPGKPGATNGPSGNRPGGNKPGTPTAPAPTLGNGQPVTLFSPELDRRGISDDEIVLCAHAALTYGQAFQTTDADFNVFWRAANDKGGVYGRRVTQTFVNDNYDPNTAVQAATTCADRKPFAILGGIGFDQIPAVRNWAEERKELYLYHAATVKGSENKRYSFTGLPTVEKLGEMFAELAISRFKNKKIGILYRNSANWEPGHKAFKDLAARHKLNIVADVQVQVNQANYTQQLSALRDAGAEVVWAWENALAATEIVKQAKPYKESGIWTPTWLVFPFNLTTQTLNEDALNPSMLGIAAWPAYSYQDYSGAFGPYSADIKEFEAQYRKYRPDTDLNGFGGDLLFLNWVAQKAIYQSLLDCGRDCTRNRYAALYLNGYKRTVSPNCPADYSGNGHHGSDLVNVFESYRAPNGKVNWRATRTCVRHLI